MIGKIMGFMSGHSLVSVLLSGGIGVIIRDVWNYFSTVATDQTINTALAIFKSALKQYGATDQEINQIENSFTSITDRVSADVKADQKK